MLNTIVKAAERRLPPPKILLYGQEGVGKTTFAAKAKKPIFIQTENGFGTKCSADAFPLVTSYDMFLDCLDALIKEKHDYKTLVVDHMDMIEHIMQREEIADSNKTANTRVKTIMKAAGGFGNGPVAVNNYLLDQVLPRLDELWLSKRMTIMLLSHCSIEKVADVSGVKSKTYAPSMDPLFSTSLRNWADCVLFARIAIGAKGEERVLCCQPSTTYFAKNRYFDDDAFPFDYEEFKRRLVECNIDVNNQQQKEIKE